MNYKLNEHITHKRLIEYGFTYREHYDNYIYIVSQPKTNEVYKELIERYNYKHDSALEQTNLKRTYIGYQISVNIKTKKVSMWTHALNDFPYEETLHQHDIPEEYIELLLDLRNRQIIIKEETK